MTAIERAPLVGRVADVARSVRSDHSTAGWAVAAAVALPALLVPAWVVADALQPSSYDPVRQTISVLAGHAGADRWLVTGALLLMGLFYVVTAAGLGTLGAAARLGLVVSGLAGLGVALCPEPARGSTVQHMAFTTIGAIALAIWPALVPLDAPPPSALLGRRAARVVTALFLALLGWTFVEAQTGPALGLAERVTTSVEVCWPLVIALALWRAARRGPAMEPVDPAARRVFSEGIHPDVVRRQGLEPRTRWLSAYPLIRRQRVVNPDRLAPRDLEAVAA